jgi:hypothetical protein
MLLVLQIGLCVLGVVLMRRKEIRAGRQVARGATPFLVGLPLVVQLPLAVMVAFGLGASAGMDAAKKAQAQSRAATQEQAQAEMQLVAQKKAAEFQAEYWWIDVVIPFCGLLAAALFLALGLKDDEPKGVGPTDPDDLLARLAGRKPGRADEDDLADDPALARGRNGD